jgi:hypothetical protein
MSDLAERILSRLRASEYWTPGTRETATTIQGLTCPECNQGNAWAYRNEPFSLNCNRLDKCGARTRTIELFDIRQHIERDHKPTPADPHRPARAYLESRGLSKATLAGLPFEYWRNVRKSGSGAVMFPIATKEGTTVYNGRLFNPPRGDGKTHNRGSTAGLYWMHPGKEYNPDTPTYIVEGILDALSLLEMGTQAIAVLSSGQDPKKLNLSPFNVIVPAFDSDNAGKRATRNWGAIFSDLNPIMPPPGRDWNDILIETPPDARAARFSKNLESYHFNARLALAETAQQYAELYTERHGNAPGIFEHEGCTYHAHHKRRGDAVFLVVERCGRFICEVVSFGKDTSNPSQPHFYYHLRLSTPGPGAPIDCTATGRDLATPRALKEFLLSRAKLNWEGGTIAATAFTTRLTTTAAPEVNQLSLTGYDVESRAYIFKHFAIDQKGAMLHPDHRGLFKLGPRKFILPPPHAGEKAIAPAASGPPLKNIYRLLFDAFGENGAAAYAWAAASLFVNQIKDKTGFFPHLSLYGDPASGKSALTSILNGMQGIEGEGLPVSQLTTKKALARCLSRHSGLFSALLEDNQRNEKAFDFSIVLTGYNAGPLQLRAAFSNDNQVHEAPFRGSLLWVINVEPFNQSAEKQRVMSLYFSHEYLDDTTRAAYEKMTSIPAPELARAHVAILQKRQEIESKWQDAYSRAITDLSPQDNRRILQNHALVLAFHRMINDLFSLQAIDLTEFIRATCKIKCTTANEKHFDQADHFFEQLETLNDEQATSCMHRDKEKRLFYVCLNKAELHLRNKGLSFVVNSHLTDCLMRHPSYVSHSQRFRFPLDPETDTSGRPKQRRTWVFNEDRMN